MPRILLRLGRTGACNHVAWCWLGCLLATASCRQSDLQSCTDPLDAKRYAAAVERCEKVYASEGNPRAGLAAARAHYFLGQGGKVLAWKDRLVKAGKVPPGIWSLAATVHLEQGETERAEQEYRLELAVSRAAGDHRRAADTLYRLYHLTRERFSDDHRRLFLLASGALQEAEKAADPVLVGDAAQAVFSVLFDIGDIEGARRTLEVARRFVAEDDRVGKAHLLNNLGNLLFAEGRLGLARRHYEQALKVGAGGASREFLRGISLNLAEVDLEIGDLDRAAQNLAEAAKHVEPEKRSPLLYLRAQLEFERKQLADASQTLATALSENPIPEWAWRLEYLRGRVAEQRSELTTAEEAFERSIAIVEEIRRSLTFDELKAWLLDKKRRPFEALFRLQARSGRPVKALATAERAQARTFLDAFVHASSSTVSTASTHWTPGVSLERMEALESLLAVMSQSSVAALQPLEQVLVAFRDRYGLVYFESGDDLWLIAVSGARVRLHPLAASATEVRRLAGRFLASPEDVSLAQRLGELLLPPGSLPEKGKAIYVVADGMLGNLPLAAVRSAGRYLVEDHAIVMIPSLTSLAALEDRRTDAFELPRILADPRGDLSAAALESREVAKLVGGTALIGKKATSTELKRASRARVLHLATHTGPGPSGPWLQLADRRVNASEIVAGRIGPRLAVLATCASGVRPGRQMWGSLGAAFLAAGSRAVLASLWSIEDNRAREFVLRFYREGGSSDPSGALARAQRVAIAGGVSPLYWGPFVLFGSDRPLNDKR